MTSRHQANPGIAIWTAVKTILKYLKTTKNIFLVYEDETELVIRGYIETSFQINRDNLRS
jgi:hypothetical protein